MHRYAISGPVWGPEMTSKSLRVDMIPPCKIGLSHKGRILYGKVSGNFITSKKLQKIEKFVRGCPYDVIAGENRPIFFQKIRNKFLRKVTKYRAVTVTAQEKP